MSEKNQSGNDYSCLNILPGTKRAQTKVAIILTKLPQCFLKPGDPIVLVLLLSTKEIKAVYELKSVWQHYNCMWLEVQEWDFGIVRS